MTYIIISINARGLLKTANIQGSIILAGQSIGGLIVRLYTESYGDNVAGLVLVDPKAVF